MYNSLHTLLKSKHVAAYLLHAYGIHDANMASIVDEKIIHEEPDSMEDESDERAERTNTLPLRNSLLFLRRESGGNNIMIFSQLEIEIYRVRIRFTNFSVDAVVTL